jgi:hypothetical protein
MADTTPITAAEHYANVWDAVASRQIAASRETGAGRGPEGAWPNGRYDDDGDLGAI